MPAIALVPMLHRLSVARDFSRTPGSRLRVEGPFSGEAFREEKLAPAVRRAIEANSNLVVDLDGTAGYASSFLEEAFGGLVRTGVANAEVLLRLLVIKSDEEDYFVEDVKQYISDEGMRAAKKA